MAIAPASLVERGPGDKPLCHVSPSLTIYLGDAPDGRLATKAIEAYRTVCPPEKQRLITGTRAPAFTKIDGPMGKAILHDHVDLMNRRRDQALAIWDGESLDSWYFTVWGVPPEEGCRRASFCKATFPNDVDPNVVCDLAIRLAAVLPFRSGHGGLTAHFDADRKTTAFNRIFVWAKRFPGLEVEDLNTTVAYVVDAVKGANWLTLVGSELWGRLTQARGSDVVLPDAIDRITTTNGVVLRAGSAPVLGDRNAGEVPELYGQVERVLAPLKLREHAEFAGRFGEESATIPWLHRLSTPDGWRW